MFMEEFCDQCRKENREDSCLIIVQSMTTQVDEEGYPPEWTHTAEGKPTCTAFDSIE